MFKVLHNKQNLFTQRNCLGIAVWFVTRVKFGWVGRATKLLVARRHPFVKIKKSPMSTRPFLKLRDRALL